MQRNLKKKGKAMARPIKETPILFGEDARRFEERMKQVRRETPEERERRLANYELALKMLELGERTRKKSVSNVQERKAYESQSASTILILHHP